MTFPPAARPLQHLEFATRQRVQHALDDVLRHGEQLHQGCECDGSGSIRRGGVLVANEHDRDNRPHGGRAM